MLGEKLHDNRFLGLLKYLLKAGYVEDWKYGRTLSGTPQGGVVSPILANIYLDRLDKFVENVLIPAHTRGTARRRNPGYIRLSSRATYRRNVGHHCQAYMHKGKPAHRSFLIHDEDYSIVEQYQSEFRGVVQYYLPASNVSHFGRLRAVMEMSLARTLAAKHKSTARQMRRKYKSVVETEHGPRVCLRVIKQRDNGKRPLVAYFGGIPLKRQRTAAITGGWETMVLPSRCCWPSMTPLASWSTLCSASRRTPATTSC